MVDELERYERVRRQPHSVSLDVDGKTGGVSAKVHKSKASKSLSDRWANAKLKQRTYNELTGEQLGSRDFFKNNNPLDNQIVIYDVSAQADYDSTQGGIYTQGQTFEVIMFKGFEDNARVEDKTKSAYGSMVVSGDTFNPNFQAAIENNTNVKMDQVRGLEEVRGRKLSKSDYDKLLQGGIVTNNLNANIKFTKNKKGNRGKDYDAKLDLTEFK